MSSLLGIAGFHAPRGAGRRLPSPRLISQRLAKNEERITPQYSMMTMAFGQFVDHDLTLAPVFTREYGGGNMYEFID